MEIKIISKIKNIKKQNYDNQYKYKIESFAEEHGYTFFDDEVIVYAMV